jgi:DNA primase
VSKGELLFGSEHIPVGKNNVYLVEGPVDALKMWGWGFKAVAVFGSDLLDRQMEKLLDVANYVIHIPDNDHAGMKFRRAAAHKLIGKVKLSQVRLPDGVKDIGEEKCDYTVICDAIENRREVNRSNPND